VLIVAPLRVANSVWAQEAKKWGHLRHLRVSICTGTEKRRIASLMMDADVYVINRENVVWLVEHFKKKWPFDMVVIDESSSFKNPSSQRFKALRKALPYTDYMVLLTGTPSPNSLLDVWSQMYMIDFGATLGRTFTGYKQRFFEQDYMGYSLTIRPGAAEAIHSLMAPNVIHMDAEDYLHMPARIDLVERVQLPAAALEKYKDFEKALLIELDSGEEIEAVSAGVLANKLLQLANGAAYTNANGAWSSFHDSKLDVLAEILEDNADENILIAYNYKFDLERLQKKFPAAVVLDKNQSTIDRWNRGEIPILLAHPASAGHGLNLQDGGALIVWFGLTWSLELYQQFNARLHRQGQKKPVRILHIVCAETIDERVLGVLSRKDSTQKTLLTALKPVD
jgi:SNF2 family DNA or RNA helicase